MSFVYSAVILSNRISPSVWFLFDRSPFGRSWCFFVCVRFLLFISRHFVISIATLVFGDCCRRCFNISFCACICVLFSISPILFRIQQATRRRVSPYKNSLIVFTYYSHVHEEREITWISTALTLISEFSKNAEKSYTTLKQVARSRHISLTFFSPNLCALFFWSLSLLLLLVRFRLLLRSKQFACYI